MVLAARHRMFPFVSSRDSDFDSSDRWEFNGEFEGGFDGEFDPVHPSDVVSSSAAHRVADVSDGGVVFVEAFAPLDSKLRSLHRRIVSAVVRGEPMPVACETLPEIDHLLARIETAWNETMREGSRR
ncbi:MAG: hypothetical protein GY895_05530, partial [Phycisphaera sp.]|nr:hypothetical protein [Phycisphaera sp.]